MAKNKSRRKSSGDAGQQPVPTTPTVTRRVPTVNTDKSMGNGKHKTKRLDLSAVGASTLDGHAKKKKSSHSSSHSSASPAAAPQSPPAPSHSPLAGKNRKDQRKGAETAEAAVTATSLPMPVMAASSQGNSRKGRSKSAKKGSASSPASASAPAPGSEPVQAPVSSPKKAKKVGSSMEKENTATSAATPTSAAPETLPRVTPNSPVAAVAKISNVPKAKQNSKKKGGPPEKAPSDVAVAAAAAAANGVVTPGPIHQKRARSLSPDPKPFNVVAESASADPKQPPKKHKAKKDTNASIPSKPVSLPPTPHSTPQTPPSSKKLLISTPASTVATTPRKRPTAAATATVVSRQIVSSVKKTKGKADSETSPGGAEGDDSEVKPGMEISNPTQLEYPKAICCKCQSGHGYLNFCVVCGSYYHPQCLDPPKMKKARDGWVCPGCTRPGIVKAAMEVRLCVLWCNYVNVFVGDELVSTWLFVDGPAVDARPVSQS